MERLLDSYAAEISRIEQDTEFGATQLLDYQSRLGQPSAHETYLSGLTSLQNVLKESLSAVATVQPVVTQILRRQEA